MVINLLQELEAAINEQARQRGVAPEILAVAELRERFLPSVSPLESHNEWERGLLGSARDRGVSLLDSALSSERLYE